MRILVIGNFFQNHKKYQSLSSEELCIREYETFCDDVREVFDLEDWAQELSTIFLSILIILSALFLKSTSKDWLLLAFSGICGILFTILIKVFYWQKRKKLKEEAEQLKKIIK